MVVFIKDLRGQPLLMKLQSTQSRFQLQVITLEKMTKQDLISLQVAQLINAKPMISLQLFNVMLRKDQARLHTMQSLKCEELWHKLDTTHKTTKNLEDGAQSKAASPTAGLTTWPKVNQLLRLDLGLLTWVPREELNPTKEKLTQPLCPTQRPIFQAQAPTIKRTKMFTQK